MLQAPGALYQARCCIYSASCPCWPSPCCLPRYAVAVRHHRCALEYQLLGAANSRGRPGTKLWLRGDPCESVPHPSTHPPVDSCTCSSMLNSSNKAGHSAAAFPPTCPKCSRAMARKRQRPSPRTLCRTRPLSRSTLAASCSVASQSICSVGGRATGLELKAADGPRARRLALGLPPQPCVQLWLRSFDQCIHHR